MRAASATQAAPTTPPCPPATVTPALAGRPYAEARGIDTT